MQSPRWSRRWLVGSVVAVLALAALIGIGMLVVYPRVGAWMIRDKVGSKVANRLGREVHFGSIQVTFGHAVLRDIVIRGPNDAGTPLVHVDRIDVEFDPWRSLVGSVRVGPAKIDGVTVTVRRAPDGQDNISDILARLQAGSGGGGSEGGTSMAPSSIQVGRIRLLADDAVTSATGLVADGSATWTRGELVAELRGISATTIAAPKAGATKIGIKKLPGRPPEISVEGGEVALYPRLALSGIAGTIHPNDARPGEYAIDLAGGYGGVPGNLWTAKGGLDPKAVTASIELVAAKFQLDRLAPILAQSAVVDYANTSVDTQIRLDVTQAGAKFGGEFHLYGLNVGHPMIAEKEVHDLDLSGTIEGSFDREARRLELTRGDFVTREVPFSVTGSATTRRKISPETVALAAPAGPKGTGAGGTVTAGAPIARGAGTATSASGSGKVKRGPTEGPGGVQELKLRLVIPPIKCQRVLNAIPTEMAPHMAGYQLAGTFDTDIRMEIDWADLDATVLDGRVGIRNCKVTKEPEDSPKRLKEAFEHHVEVETDKWLSFEVGEDNEDFVPFDQISPHLVNSVMSTEDSAFYSHKGFIPSEFRTALINDLKASKFTHGASSITMQMVKNVLLYREKTLARKLQELFLTWHVENTLTKDRILEIYFNVIEYGPALFGIGPAARHYFDKEAKDLNPREAAFFSSILPDPKRRYAQYCAGEVTRATDDKIKFYLGVMLKRKRLTDAEYEAALATPLVFVKSGDETEDECMKRTRKIIKNTRSTNPMKQGDEPPRKKPGRDKDRERERERRKQERERERAEKSKLLDI